MNVKRTIRNCEMQLNNEKTELMKFYIDSVIRYIKQKAKKHPELSPMELKRSIEKEFVESCNEYHEVIEELSGIQIQSMIIDYLIQHPERIIEEYRKIKDKKLTEDPNEYYSYDKEKSIKLCIKTTLMQMREYSKQHGIPIEYEEKYLMKIISLSPDQIDKMQKEYNIKMINCMLNFFDKYSMLEKNVNSHNNALRKLWIEELGYSLEEVIGCFEEKNLMKAKTDELYVLNMFWQNRFAKEMGSISEAYFVIQQLGFWENFGANLEINNEILRQVHLKYNVISQICATYYNEIISKKTHELHINSSAIADYQEIFDKKSPNLVNDLISDIDECYNGCMARKNIYAIKTNLCCGRIVKLVNNKKIKNWGYIPTEEDKSYILIGIDWPGYNMPARVHVQKDILIESLTGMENGCIIPIYDGNEDFILNYDVVPTNLFLPLQKHHKTFLREWEKKGSRSFQANMLSHIRFLSNEDKFPEHLKEEKDGEKIRVRKYINLVSGEMYTKQDNKYVELNSGDELDER